jgi:hypothetical protein
VYLIDFFREPSEKRERRGSSHICKSEFGCGAELKQKICVSIQGVGCGIQQRERGHRQVSASADNIKKSPSVFIQRTSRPSIRVLLRVGTKDFILRHHFKVLCVWLWSPSRVRGCLHQVVPIQEEVSINFQH